MCIQAPNRPPRIYSRDTQLHGSAKWATREHLKARHYGENGALFLGYAQNEHKSAKRFQIRANPVRHALTVAPTRSGKLLTTCMPICLEHKGGLVVTDVKSGEIALIAALYRRDVLGHKVIIIDPWDEVCSNLGIAASHFNVLDWIDPEDENYIDDAFLIAGTIVTNNGATDPFWSEEAIALIYGLIILVCTTSLILLPTEKKSRDLPQVRRLLNLPPQEFFELVEGKFEKDKNGKPILISPGMAQSRNEHVRSAAARIMNKSSKEFSGVMSTAQSNMHFLESSAVQRALSKSDFSMSELESSKVDIFIVMPAERIITHNRFMRLMISIIITSVIRFKKKPSPPIYFLLEEMPCLGRMEVIETAFSLLAGFGLILHVICQDFSQLAAIYPRWQTFIANSGVIQVFATRDLFTVEYVSKLCGVGTVESVSEASSEIRAGLITAPNYFSREDSVHARNLITLDEIMTMHPSVQLLILSHADPVICFKSVYFLDKRYRQKDGKPLFGIHPNYAHLPIPPAINFSNPQIDIGGVIDNVINGGQ